MKYNFSVYIDYLTEFRERQIDLTDESEAEEVALEFNWQDNDLITIRSWKNELANKELTNTLEAACQCNGLSVLEGISGGCEGMRGGWGTYPMVGGAGLCLTQWRLSSGVSL